MHKGDHYLSILMQPLGTEGLAVFINDQNICADMQLIFHAGVPVPL